MPTTAPARRRATLLLTAAHGAALAVAGIAITVGPLALQEMTGRPAWGGALFAAFIVGSGAGALGAGRLIDRVGARGPLAGAHALAGAAGTAAALATAAGSPRLVVACAAVTGVGQGAALLGRVAVAEMHPPGERGRIVGRMVGAGAVGAVGAPVTVAALAAGAAALGGDPRAIPWLGVTALGGLGAVATLASGVGGRRRRAAAGVRAPAGARAEEPGPPLRLAVLAVTVAQATMAAVMVAAPAAVHHHGGEAVTVVVAVHFAAMYAAAPLVGRVVDRLGATAGIAAGAASCTAGALLLPLTQSPPAAAAALFAVGLGWSAGYLSCTALLSSRHDGPGRALGGADLAAGTAAAAAALAAGAFGGAVAGPVAAAIVAAPSAAVLVVAASALMGRRSAPAPSAAPQPA